MMPNNTDAVPSTEHPSTEHPSTAAQSISSIQESAPARDEPATQDTRPQDTVNPSQEQAPAHALFSQDEDDGANDWLASDEPTTQEPPSQEASTHPELPAETVSEEPPVDTAPRTNGKPSQHSSSMSFARTVSHDISFGDDDDGDWNLSRTDTDPFKFMPPTDRTNSFPAVPPMPQVPDSHSQQPLPSTQALGVLEENERDVDAEEQRYQKAASEGLDAPETNHPASLLIGGDLRNSEGQDSDERFEEGIPLIPRATSENTSQNSENTTVSPAIPFDDEGADGDDFFSQIQDSDAPAVQQDSTPPLERKSTMQAFTNSMKPGELSRQSTLEETPEEDLQPRHDVGPVGTTETTTEAKDESPKEDLAAKWEQAFGEDEGEGFLEDPVGEDNEIDPSAFLGSDDEGLLDDVDDAMLVPVAAQTTSARQASGANTYLPQTQVTQSTPSPYAPTMPMTTPSLAPQTNYATPAPTTNQFGAAPQYGQPPPQRPDMNKAQSFADKSKGGYSSPYDLPSDLVTNVVKPRKRSSMQQLSQAVQAPPPPGPQRSASHGPPPVSTQGQQAKPSNAGAQHKDNFFEDLPMAHRPRPSSRVSIRAPSPALQPPMAHGAHVPSPLMSSAVPQMPPPIPAPSQAAPPAHTQPGASLVGPDRVSPYAALDAPAAHMPPPISNVSRYSPAPPGGNQSAPPVPASSRYSPAPPAVKSHASYGPVSTAAVPPPILSPHQLPHQPRTSSPLTHWESSNGVSSLAEHRASAGFEPRMNRVSSLPPTREVDEDDDQMGTARSLSATHTPLPHSESRYTPMSPPKTSRHTPPPPSYAGQLTLSPPKQSACAPQAYPTTQIGFAPPPRAQTQSPSASFGHQASMSSDSTKRPSSAHSHRSPVTNRTSTHSAYAPAVRTRGQSLTMNMVPPTDGREQDPLQRWKGVPIMSWGVGGTIVTSFPKSVPRYGMNQSVPTIVRTPGEVNVRTVKDLEPLQDRLSKFPGPLRGKSKKKETLAWLSAGIENLQKDLPEVSFHAHLSLQAKRSIERQLLWRILHVFIEHDGVLEGNSAVDKAVRDVLSPGTEGPTADYDAMFPPAGGLGVGPTSMTSMQADGADISTMDEIRRCLLLGDREKAVWSLVDKRLWGHAMLISQTVEGDLYKRVAQEFVRKEVNYPGHNNESMAALYKVLSGNFDDCVDELVPVHARAGLQLVSTEASSGPTKSTLDGLDKWRETLSLILSNRSANDVRGLNALGSLLSSYGRAEAAHICFIFGRKESVFGGLDDADANIVLLGADHRQQSDQFAKETEALQLSEVYEYGISLAGGVAATAGIPHLAAYKLQHAMVLAEYGHRDKALQYCDAIATAITAQTKRSTYHHAVLEAAVEDLLARLKQAPKEETKSWISKPSMNKVSDSMWNKFNKFVAGDEADGNGIGPGGEESGPFGRIATTPTMSRSPSTSNFDIYGGQSPSYGMTAAPPAPMTAAASRYAPGAVPMTPSSNPYEPTSQFASAAARSSMDRNSGEYPRNSYEPSYAGAIPAASGNVYAPASTEPSMLQESAGTGVHPGLAPAAQITQAYSPAGYQPYGLPSSDDTRASHTSNTEHQDQNPSQGYQPPNYGYAPPSMAANPSENEPQDAPESSGGGGYEPPSFQPYGYEPPAYDPNPESTTEVSDDAPKPKKKSFMDNDEDDFPPAKNASQSKADKDRENEEMFRQAAEEDGKFSSSPNLHL